MPDDSATNTKVLETLAPKENDREQLLDRMVCLRTGNITPALCLAMVLHPAQEPRLTWLGKILTCNLQTQETSHLTDWCHKTKQTTPQSF